jgi:hypothetical protein
MKIGLGTVSANVDARFLRFRAADWLHSRTTPRYQDLYGSNISMANSQKPRAR